MACGNLKITRNFSQESLFQDLAFDCPFFGVQEGSGAQTTSKTDGLMPCHEPNTGLLGIEDEVSSSPPEH
jgi:hypothetical protein